MKSFVKQKNNNNIWTSIIALTIWSYFFVSFVSLSLSSLIVVAEAKKVQYGELLTDDNELFLVESAPVAAKQAAKPKSLSKNVPAAAQAAKPHPIVRRSVSTTTNSTDNNKSKPGSVTSVKTTKKPSVDPNNKTTKKTIKPKTTTKIAPVPSPNKVIDTNKLIVKIVYTSSNSADQARSDLTKLVYSTSESLSPCEKAPCKSTEVKYLKFNS